MQRVATLQRDATYIPTPMSRGDIASYLGLTPESLSRALSALKQQGVIEADRHHVEILKPNRLAVSASHLF